ncbi:MAG: InlB B-repeat-containing protein, partial [Clostridia bacterium]|nr:InlB B-repeat-containing protein [Clostridia bacterium]
MKNIRKILAIVLCLMMVMPLATTGVLAADDPGPYNIFFNANGGTLTSQEHFVIAYGQKIGDVIPSMPTAVRDGYTLTGWYNEQYGYTLSLDDYWSVRSGAVFIALWEKNSGGGTTPTPTGNVIILDPNGGTLTGASTFSFTPGQKYVDIFGGSIPTPTRSGYTFQGWDNEDYQYTIPADDPNAAIPLDGTWTFKAQWKSGGTTPT